jgi:hypothetical protein
MAGKNMVTGLLAVVVVGVLIYFVDPTFFGLLNYFKLKQGFEECEEVDENGNCIENFEDEDIEDFEDTENPDDEDTFANLGGATSNGAAAPGQMSNPGAVNALGNLPPSVSGFADLSSQEGPANFGTSGSPAGCYPRDQLTPSELLPKDKNSVWAEQNPMGPGSLKGKNFLSAGALIGVNTVGQSLRNANLQLRSEPPNPQVAVSIFNQSTIAPDTNRRPLEIN